LVKGFLFGKSEGYYDELNRFAETPLLLPHHLIPHLTEYTT